MLTWASVLIFPNLIEDSPWSGPAVESFVSSSVCLQALQPRRPRLWALTAQGKSCSLVEICFLLSEVFISLSCNLPADQIFNILSQEPLQNCEGETQTLWIFNPNHSYFFSSATPPSIPWSQWGLWRRCPRSPCAPDSSVWLSPCSSQSSTPTAGRFGPERPSEAERSDRLHAQTPNRCFKKGFVTTEPAVDVWHLRPAHLFWPRLHLWPPLCARPPSSPPCPPRTRSWPSCRMTLLGSWGRLYKISRKYTHRHSHRQVVMQF